jgi:hypothetical protein
MKMDRTERRKRARARYDARIGDARRYFREHRSEATPDVAFATRVVANLPPRRENLLGWAAVRVLPATLILAVVLAIWAVRVAPVPDSLLQANLDEDLLSWVVETSETGP